MAVITFPTTIKPLVSTMRAVATVGIGESPFTLQAQKQVFNANRWEIDLEYPPITDASTAAELEAFIMQLNGQENTTLVPNFDRPTPIGIGTGTPLVNGASQTGESLITDGWTVSQTGILAAGDYIQVENYMYMVVTSSDSDGSGNSTLSIRPELKSSPANNAPIVVAYPATLCRLAANVNSCKERS